LPDLNLSEREREEIVGYIQRGQKLPPKYKSLLFEQPNAAELIWPGKTSEVTNVVLPFQQIEQIDEPRKEGSDFADLFAWDQRTGRQTGGWTNKLIWGDNRLVLSSLKNGPLRRQIEDAGGLKLVYIDPPFDVGADFSLDIEVGDETVVKQPSLIEDVAYRDTWGHGVNSYASMVYERILAIHSLLHEDGYFYCHVDSGVNALVRIICDEIFGSKNFLNHIIWSYRRWPANSRNWQTMHDDILFYAKHAPSRERVFNTKYEPPSESYLKRFGGKTQVLDEETKTRKITVDEPTKGMPLRDVWDISMIAGFKAERVGYPTQKPEELLDRIIDVTTDEGDLVADFFCGSGTTLAVAEKLGRKWIGCDLGRFAIHTSRKRLIGVQRELKAAGKPYRSFEILNLGRYERQYFVGIDPTLPEQQRKALSARKEGEFLQLILQAYKAEPVDQTPPFHGRKAGAFVVVGPIDAPVTRSLIDDAVEAARAIRAARVDVLGFEFEMGLVPQAQEEARARGVALALQHIPKDVFDKRAVEKDQVVFHDVAYLDARSRKQGLTVTVELTDFGVFYSQGDIDAMTAAMKNKSSKVEVDRGQVWKVSKDKDGIVTREQLTRHWTDWIDYWAVDFNFESKCELVTITDAEGNERQASTGGYIFENEWQSFRTRKDRTLELTSAEHDYAAEGTYKIAVKVIDIFGNDTTKVFEVTV
jgi:adenine-specific DNA-methyltransferase